MRGEGRCEEERMAFNDFCLQDKNKKCSCCKKLRKYIDKHFKVYKDKYNRHGKWKLVEAYSNGHWKVAFEGTVNTDDSSISGKGNITAKEYYCSYWIECKPGNLYGCFDCKHHALLQSEVLGVDIGEKASCYFEGSTMNHPSPPSGVKVDNYHDFLTFPRTEKKKSPGEITWDDTKNLKWAADNTILNNV